MADRIQLRRDTAANWTSVNPVLAQGELGIETDTNKFKVGNGTSSWTSLSYLIDVGNYLTASSTNTLTNKTWQSNAIAIAYGGTGATTAAAALTNLGAYAASNPNGYTSNTGTITSIATSSPLTGGTITTSGTIGIQVANSTQSGYLSSTDWNTFNNKTSNTGTVTSVGGTGTVSGLTLTGTVTSSGNLTLGGTLSADASAITSGTISTARLGSGTADSTTYLRGDNTWATISGGGATVSDDTTTNATRYIVWEDVTSGSSTTIGVSSTKLYFNPSSGTLYATVFQSLSDATLKENVKPVSNSIGTLNQIQGVEYTWKDTGKRSYGVIAQEIEKILPDVVDTSDDGLKSVNYTAMTAFFIEAIKQLSAEIEQLKRTGV